MAKRRPNQSADLIKKVAVLIEDGYTQQTISDFLSITQARVSQLAKQATDEGILVVATHIPEGFISPTKKQEILDSVLPFSSEALEEVLMRIDVKQNFRQLKVVHTGQKIAPESQLQDWDDACIEFGKNLAPNLENLLDEDAGKGGSDYRIGVCGGRTIFAICQGLRGRNKFIADFIPIWPEVSFFDKHKLSSVFKSSSQLSATRHCDRFLSKLSPNKNDACKYDLRGIPAFIPISNDFPFSIDDIKKVHSLTGSYDRVVSELWNELHAVVLPIGSKEQLKWLVADQKTIDRDALSKVVYGDIGGVLLERTLDREAKKKFKYPLSHLENVKQHWLGISRENLEQSINFAKENDSLGVIAVGVGSKRAESALVAIKSGMVNHLFVDGSCAMTIKRKLESRRDLKELGFSQEEIENIQMKISN